MNNQVTASFFVTKGDVPGELRVSDQNKFYVVMQIWKGKYLLDTRIDSSYKTRAAAEARLTEIKHDAKDA